MENLSLTPMYCFSLLLQSIWLVCIKCSYYVEWLQSVNCLYYSNTYVGNPTKPPVPNWPNRSLVASDLLVFFREREFLWFPLVNFSTWVNESLSWEWAMKSRWTFWGCWSISWVHIWNPYHSKLMSQLFLFKTTRHNFTIIN